jgi:hypothetical protein
LIRRILAGSLAVVGVRMILQGLGVA